MKWYKTSGLIVLLIISSILPLQVFAEDFAKVQVTSAFIDVHTGPGRGYPQFYVVERGEWIEVLERKTDWFKVRLNNKKEGWVYRDQLEQTLSASGNKITLTDSSFEDFYQSRWELGVSFGDFAGANSISLTGSVGLTVNISLELDLTQFSGQLSDGYKAHLNVFHEAFPEWAVSPYFLIGAGIMHTDPKATLVATENRDDELLAVGGGARIYITRKVILKAEYKHFVVLTEREQNEELEQWILGFSIFF